MPVIFRHRGFRFFFSANEGRTLGVPLAWFPRLLNATAAQRRQVRSSPRGLHWQALDEDISIAGLLAGQGDLTRQRPVAA